MSKKILITGGSGFIGRNLLESSLAEKYELIAPRHAELDLIDTQSVDSYFASHEFDVVLHSAVKPAHRNAADPTRVFYSNMRMFANLERNCDHFGKLINFGSGAIYDVAANNSGVSEEAIYRNMGADDHSFCKYMVHKQIDHLENFVDLNIFGIFGRYEDYSIRFISNAICKAIHGLPITLRQNRRFSYLDVRDLPAILELFIEGTPQHKSYNIVPDGYAELKQLAEMVQALSPTKPGLHIAAEGYGLDYYGSNARLMGEFPAIRFTPMAESVADLYHYYDTHRDLINRETLLVDK